MKYSLLTFLFLPLLALGVELKEIRYPVAVDDSQQLAMMQVASKPGRPLLLALHSWSGDYRQSSCKKYAAECAKRDWNMIFPNFRGPNKTRDSCGSELVIADLVAAVAYAKATTKADASRVYVMGESGGGYATLLIAARHPELFAAASAWVPIHDLAKWHADTKKAGSRYWKMIEGATGGAPGSSKDVDAQYKIRSTKHWLKHETVKNLPIHINAGIHDGHKGSVPIDHTLNAFNAITVEADQFTSDQISYMVTKRQVPAGLVRKAISDPSYGNKSVLLRRTSGNATVTLFDGGHESITPAGIQWLAQFTRSVPAIKKVSFKGDSIKIGLIGDSTVAVQSGWGPAFAKRFNANARIINYAKNGATLQSLSKRLDALLAQKPNFVLVQFGHNDQKRYDTKTYANYLESYIDRIQKAGSKAIILSSVTRRTFDANGKIISLPMKPRTTNHTITVLTDYAQAAKAVAKKRSLPFIDLHARSIAHHNQLGQQASMSYNFKKGDLTHFNAKGGEAISGLVLQECKIIIPKLSEFLR